MQTLEGSNVILGSRFSVLRAPEEAPTSCSGPNTRKPFRQPHSQPADCANVTHTPSTLYAIFFVFPAVFAKHSARPVAGKHHSALSFDPAARNKRCSRNGSRPAASGITRVSELSVNVGGRLSAIFISFCLNFIRLAGCQLDVKQSQVLMGCGKLTGTHVITKTT